MEDGWTQGLNSLRRAAPLGFDVHEPLTAELSIKIQPSVLAALQKRCHQKHDGHHDFSRHVREMIVEWLIDDNDCFECIFVKDAVARN